MDDLTNTASATALGAAASTDEAPTPSIADQAIENWIAAGRAVVAQHLEPLERLAAQPTPYAHEFAVIRNSFSAALHGLLSHIAHEDHPGVIAEAAKLAEPVAEDVEGVIGAASEGDVSGAISEGAAAVRDGAEGAAEVAADLAAGAPLVTAEDAGAVEEAVADGVAAAVEPVQTSTVSAQTLS